MSLVVKEKPAKKPPKPIPKPLKEYPPGVVISVSKPSTKPTS
jgi:hypothetical protein